LDGFRIATANGGIATAIDRSVTVATWNVARAVRYVTSIDRIAAASHRVGGCDALECNCDAPGGRFCVLGGRCNVPECWCNDRGGDYSEPGM